MQSDVNMCSLISFILICLISINVNALDYDGLFLAEVKPKITEQCYKGMARGGKGLREFIVKAVSAWNATTPGLLNGAHDYTGNYEGCLSAESGADLAQYCVFDVTVAYEEDPPEVPSCSLDAQLVAKPCSSDESGSQSYMLKWALCAVGSCGESNLLALAEALLQKSEIGRAGLPFKVSLPENACQTSAKIPFRTDTIVFFFLVGAIAVLVTICTVWHWSYRRMYSREPSINAPPLVRNWSVIEHLSSLTEPSSDDIQVFHGLKVMSNFSIMAVHGVVFMFAGPVANLRTVLIVLSGLGVTRPDLAADSFFAMAGFILVKNYLSSNSKSLIESVLTRYFRIMPVYALMIFYASSVLEYTGSGPFWPAVVNAERDSCRKNWWLSLLMLGNYCELKRQCWLISWYIPCDFHFFIVGILICRLIKKNETLGVAFLSALLVAAVVFLGTYIGLNKMPVSPPLVNDTVRDLRHFDEYVDIYTKSQFRIPSYLVGMLGGYAAYLFLPKVKVISQRTAIIGLLLSVAIMVVPIASGILYGSDVPYYPVKAALYGALTRPLWALGFVLCTLVFVFGKIDKVTAFFEMRIWLPLSRLTYCMYLVHMAIIYRDIGGQMQPLVMDVPAILFRVALHLVLTVGAALVLHLCVEKPSYGLFKMSLAAYRKLAKAKLE